MKTKAFTINGHSGKAMVINMDLPNEGYPSYYCIYVPCFTCTKDLRMIKHIAKRLTKYNVALVRFDFPGLGVSAGNFADTSYSTNLENIRIVTKWLEENFDAPKLGIGHSMGGSAMMKFAQEYEPMEALVTIAAPSKPDHLRSNLKRNVIEAEETGSSKRIIGGIEFTLTKNFFDDLVTNAGEYDLSKLKKPILILHSPDDDTVPVDEAREIFQQVRGQRSYIMLNNYGHLIMDKKNAQVTADIIYNWAEMYLNIN